MQFSHHRIGFQGDHLLVKPGCWSSWPGIRTPGRACPWRPAGGCLVVAPAFLDGLVSSSTAWYTWPTGPRPCPGQASRRRGSAVCSGRYFSASQPAVDGWNILVIVATIARMAAISLDNRSTLASEEAFQKQLNIFESAIVIQASWTGSIRAGWQPLLRQLIQPVQQGLASPRSTWLWLAVRAM